MGKGHSDSAKGSKAKDVLVIKEHQNINIQCVVQSVSSIQRPALSSLMTGKVDFMCLFNKAIRGTYQQKW
jgi:hypothetical protein